MKKELIFKPVVYWVIGVYIALSYLTLGMGNAVASFSFREDHYFENVGAISLFAASLLFFYVFFNSRKAPLKDRIFWVKQLVFLGFALLFFFGGGEEISWGQRIFNIKTPESLNKINAQGEITVHNISFMGHQLPFESEFDVLWMTVTVLVPVVALFAKPLGEFADKMMPVVHWGIGALFTLDYGLAKVAKVVFVNSYNYSEVPFAQAVQEVKESHYELLFAFFALYVLLAVMKLKRDSSTQA